MTSTRTARKAHACQGCQGTIPAGSRYVDERRVSAPGVALRWHEGCRPTPTDTSDLRDAVEHGWEGHKVWWP